jgi:hypothetical protein
VTQPSGTDKPEVKAPGLMLVFFDAPDTPEVRNWLFGEHAKAVVAAMPGVTRSQSFQILNPEQPGQQSWLTILETNDIAATWNFRWISQGRAGKAAADQRGVRNRREFFVRQVNDVRRGS